MSDPKVGDHKTDTNLPRALRDALPLKLWTIVGVVCALCLAAGLGMMQWARVLELENMDVRVSREQRLVESLPPFDARRGPLAIFIGSSLIHHAIDDPIPFEKQIAADAKVLVFHLDDPRTAWIEKILPIAERARPDLLLVQYEILEPPIGEQTSGFRDSIVFIAKAMRRGVDFVPVKSVAEQCARKRTFREAFADYDEVEISRTPTLAPLPVLERLRRNGVRVVILSLPRAEELESEQPVLARWRTQTVSALQARGFEVWTPPGKWKSDSFCDFAHLNSKGRARFDPWLAAKIRQELDLASGQPQ